MKKSELTNLIKEAYAEVITEDEQSTPNFDKWRRSMNGKAFCSYTWETRDPFGNTHLYEVYIKYKETPDADVITFREVLTNKSRTAFAVSNLQNKPSSLFSKVEDVEFINEDEFNNMFIVPWMKNDIVVLLKSLDTMFKDLVFDKSISAVVSDWFKTGTENIVDKSRFKTIK